MATWCRKARKGFTLVELLVVIAIIMVLSAMVSVGLSRAQKQAKTLHCMNNLRMVGESILAYTTGRGNGYLPNFGFALDWDLFKKHGAKPNIDVDIRVADSWLWELDFISEADQYMSRQVGVTADTSLNDQIIPPRMAPPVLSCPVDPHLFVYGQSVLTSYWMHPRNSYEWYASIGNRTNHILGLEGDAMNETGGCGCRFHVALHPKELDTSHYGGGHILFADGSVRLITEPVKLNPSRLRLQTWEKECWKDQYGQPEGWIDDPGRKMGY